MNFLFLRIKKYKIIFYASAQSTNLLSDSAVLDTNQCTIENNLPPLPNDNVEANEILHHIKSAVNEVSEDVVGTKTHKD